MVTHTYMDVWGNPLEKVKALLGTNEVDVLNNYTNHNYDEVLGIYYAKARMYDPVNHRFMAVDPVKDGLNWYSYCGNNPVNFVDSTGMFFDELRNWLSGSGWNTIEDLREEGINWASWDITLNERLAERIQKFDYLTDNLTRMIIFDEIIYQEAEKLQRELGGIYGASSSSLFASHIMHETLEPLFTLYNRPFGCDQGNPSYVKSFSYIFSWYTITHCLAKNNDGLFEVSLKTIDASPRWLTVKCEEIWVEGEE